MNLLRGIGPLGLWALSSTALAQSCPPGNPRVAPDSRYIISTPVAGQQVVTDLATGLMWKRCSEGQFGVNCSGTASTHIWSLAFGLANGSTHAGFSDWRLPNREELRSLVETACFSPSINTTVFPSTPSGIYWTSTTYAPAANVAWVVYFIDGGLSDSGGAKLGQHEVRLVRGGQSLDRFASERDAEPDAFSLAAQTAVPLSSERTSDPVSVAGLTTVTGIGVSGAAGSRYSINGGAYTHLPGAVAQGDVVRVRHTSAATPGTATTTTLVMGGVAADFVTTTVDASDLIFADGFEG